MADLNPFLLLLWPYCVVLYPVMSDHVTISDSPVGDSDRRIKRL